MAKRKIYFRADASATIGYGHFIRSLALADMLREDFECTFFTTSPTAYQLGEMEKVCGYVILHEENKFESFLNQLQGDEIVVLDNYFFTTEYQKQIKKKGSKLVCVDDMHDKHYVADVIINQSLTEQSLFDTEPYTKLCLGLDWVLLRAPFLSPPPPKSTTISRPFRVALCFGGADPLNLTYQALTQLVKVDDIGHIDVIGGQKSEQIQDSRVHFYQGIGARAIYDIFSNCAIAFVSLSTVCIEALMCGAHVVSGWYVDNQREGYDVFMNMGVIRGMGYIANGLPDLRDYLNFSIHNNVSLPKDIPTRYRNLFKSI